MFCCALQTRNLLQVCMYLSLPLLITGQPPYSKELESELRQELFSKYETNQRPKQLVNVRTALSLLALNSLDIKEQKMSITAYFHFAWTDGRLRWHTNSTYTNIKFLFAEESEVWTPAIVVENSVNDFDVISRPKIPLRIVRFGIVSWMPGGIFTTHCESDITYWPLDTQQCDVIITSWAYTSNEVVLEFDNKIFVIKAFKENGEWELLSHNYSTGTSVREDEKFSPLMFTLTFRRRPLFHVLNTLFPVVLMGFLTVIIFKLNPESGERVGLSLTILLAYAVYLGLISDSIPQTSMSASLLSTYLAAILLLQTLAVFLTVLYLDIYFRSEEKEIPRWLRTMTMCCLVKLVCLDCGKPRNKVSPEKTSRQNAESTSGHGVVIPRKQELPMEEINNETPNDAFEDGNDVTNEDKNDNDDFQYSWKDIALMLDKITMYVYLVLVSGFSSMLFSVMLAHYISAYRISV